MKTAQSTPGPWKAKDSRVFAADGFEIADTAGVHLHKTYDSDKGHWANLPDSHREIPKAEEEATARLIAKAWLIPKLLNLLTAASHALASYQYGNASSEPAHEIVELIDEFMAQIEAEG